MLCGNCRALLPKNARECYNCGFEISENIPAPELNILVVEDDENMAQLLKTWLESAGMKCRLEANGNDAWERFKKERFDLGVFDFDIPFIDGLTLTRKIKERKPYFPVLICTGYTQIIESSKIQESGADAFLSKPFQMEPFLYQVQKLTFGAPSLE